MEEINLKYVVCELLFKITLTQYSISSHTCLQQAGVT